MMVLMFFKKKNKTKETNHRKTKNVKNVASLKEKKKFLP